MTQMPHWLWQRAQLTPERLALASGSEGLSFQELHERSARVAQQLAAAGVRPGDHVALLARNGASYVELVHAISYVGGILLPLNARLTPPEVGTLLRGGHAGFLIHDAENGSTAARVSADGPDLTLFTPSRVPYLSSQPLDEIEPAQVPLRTHIDLDQPYAIMFTSGTTGRSKGVVLTYGNFWWSAIGSALNLGHHADDTWLACLPLFHVGGLAILLRSAIYGITAIVHETFDPVAVNRAIDAEGVTIVSVVSTMLQRMLDKREGGPYPPSLRCILLGGGPAPRPLLERCAALGAPVVQTYGLTETASQIATLAPEDALRKLGSAGKPLPGANLRIEADGRPASAAEVGEIVVRGPMVTPGYIDQAAWDTSPLTDDWLHTGDIGYLDGEGYLYVLDRRNDLIISGGENVYPAEVEAVLLRHPAVAEAGVTGVPDDEWGQTAVAFVTLKSGENVPADDLIAFCRERLAGYKTPREVQFVPSLPRNAAGKIVRSRLRESLTE